MADALSVIGGMALICSAHPNILDFRPFSFVRDARNSILMGARTRTAMSTTKNTRFS